MSVRRGQLDPYFPAMKCIPQRAKRKLGGTRANLYLPDLRLPVGMDAVECIPPRLEASHGAGAALITSLVV